MKGKIMGAWSHESFGNDDACDFAIELESTNDLSAVEEAFNRVLSVEGEYLEAPEASQAIAAAEVIARLQGHWGKRDAYSRAVDEWVIKTDATATPALVQKALKVLDRVLVEPSELLELWEQDEAWKASIYELMDRIRL
jgi:hypothetical protein